MSQPSFSLDEELPSPDPFSEPETLQSPESQFFDESNCTSPGIAEPEPSDDVPEWKGVGMDEIYKGLGPFGYGQNPPIRSSQSHTVLFMLPLTGGGPPKPYPAHRTDKWNVGYVRMPHSSHSLYPTEQPQQQPGGHRQFRLRWEVIQEKLLRSFLSSAELETAILAYNNKYAQRWNFTALHNFFAEIAEEETSYFFANLLPKIIQLALQLPTLITGAIPLLKQHTNGSISFSQLQVASLLANAFLCTFPRRNSTNPQSEYAAYPYINFNRLFSAWREDRPNRSDSVMEKLKCVFHYFRRVTTKAPEGTITIERRYVPKENCPKWEKIDERLPLLHITSKGTIETEGAGLLQVDFANKYVGGGVLNWGCVQEEIRFVICPELMVTMLVTEALDDTEALVVTGIERYSNYEGYSNNFTWTGDYVDETPRDNSGRRRTSVVAIDALFFKQPNTQFSKENILRELNKAYVGFSCEEMSEDSLPAIATGNWGCGAFRGNPKLKVLLQLMAAAVSGRSMVYFTFGDTNLRDNVADMYWHLVQRNINIAQLFDMLSQYENAPSSMRSDFYRFLYNRSKIKPLTEYFTVTKDNTKSKEPKASEELKESNRLKEKSSEDRPKISREPRLSTGSVALENYKYQEEAIVEMLEKSVTSDTEKTSNTTTNEKFVNDDREPKERTNSSLWDALKQREIKSTSTIKKNNVPNGFVEIVRPNEIFEIEKKIPIRESSLNSSPVGVSTSSIDKNKFTVKKSQTKIRDFFPPKMT